MKKHLLILLVAAAMTVTAKAQIQRGYYLIGGDLAGFSLGLSDGKPFNMSITPKVAWFTTDNLAVGGFVDIGLSTAEGAGTTFNYGVGPLARYYFGAADVSTTTTSARRSSRFFLEGTVGLQGVNVSGGSSTNGLGIGIGPGLAYFVTENIALEGLLKYTKAFGFGNDGGSSLLQLGVGFQIYLPRGTIRNQANKISQ
ncbi:outer membrane beta-barrel protein [Flavisolibacter sp. BT320]|nr:outer membrane beta-barrel protein [Flavisolibacter longurius]